MARALLSRAEDHRDWIGDDHGTPYETAMLAGSVPDEIQIRTKEIFDHLRAALDYCAQEVWRTFSAQPTGAKVYFPVAAPGAKSDDFLSIINRLMPGVVAQKPDVLPVFASFQEFADPANAWLPELATLTNQAKHDHLIIASTPATQLRRWEENGINYMGFGAGCELRRGGTPWMLVSPVEHGGAEDFQAVFLQIEAIRMELSGFLKEAIVGTRRVIDRSEALLAS